MARLVVTGANGFIGAAVVQALAARGDDGPADRLTALLRSEGVERLYSHQAQAADAIRAGRDVVISTGGGPTEEYHVKSTV